MPPDTPAPLVGQSSSYPIDAKEAAKRMGDARDGDVGIPPYWRDSAEESAADGYLAGYRAGLSDARAIVATLATEEKTSHA